MKYGFLVVALIINMKYFVRNYIHKFKVVNFFVGRKSYL